MNLASQSQKSLIALVSFLNSHSLEPFTQEDLQWLFQVPSLARVLNRVIAVPLEGGECVLGVDELQVYRIPLTLKAETQI
jgi:hypothetical protein